MARRRTSNQFARAFEGRSDVKTMRRSTGVEFGSRAGQVSQLGKIITECVDMDVINESQAGLLIHRHGIPKAVKLAKRARRELSDPFRFVVGGVKQGRLSAIHNDNSIQVTRLMPDHNTREAMTSNNQIVSEITGLDYFGAPGIIVAQHVTEADALAHANSLERELGAIGGAMVVDFTSALSETELNLTRFDIN